MSYVYQCLGLSFVISCILLMVCKFIIVTTRAAIFKKRVQDNHSQLLSNGYVRNTGRVPDAYRVSVWKGGLGFDGQLCFTTEEVKRVNWFIDESWYKHPPDSHVLYYKIVRL